MCFRCTTYFRGIPSYALPVTAGIRQNLLRKSVQPATDRVIFRQGPMAPGLHCPRLAGALAPCVLSPSTSFSIWIYGIPSGPKSQGQKGEISHDSGTKMMQEANLNREKGFTQPDNLFFFCQHFQPVFGNGFRAIENSGQPTGNSSHCIGIRT